MLSAIRHLVSFAAARAGVTQHSPFHAAASNQHTFPVSRNKPITVQLSFSRRGSHQKCPPITWLLLFAKWPSSLSSKWRIMKTGVQSWGQKNSVHRLLINSRQKLAISKLIEGRKVFSLHRAPSRVNNNPQDWSEHLNVSLQVTSEIWMKRWRYLWKTLWKSRVNGKMTLLHAY